MRKMITASFILFSVSSFGMECGPQVDDFGDVEQLLNGIQEKKRDWWAASEEKILKANCRKEFPSLAEQEKYLKNLADGAPAVKSSVNGVSIEDSPAMVALFKDLTTFVSFSDEVPADFKELGKKYNIPSECKKVTCALGKMFGEKRAKEMLYLKQKFGLNTSPLTKTPMQEFSEAELTNIKKAVMDYPPHLLPLDENQQCTRLHKDYTLGLGTLANATITFANDWNKYPAAIQQSTVLHELGHNFGSAKNLDENKDWLALSGWVQKDEEWSSSKDNFVSDYAASNPYEDFAETVVAFRYDPAKLKAISPEKYKFMKDKLFGGVEYLRPEMCADTNLFVSKSLAKIKPSLEKFSTASIDETMKKNLVSYCNQDSYEIFMDRNYKPYEDCMEGAIALELAKKQLKQDNPTLSSEELEANFFSKLNGRSAKEAFGITFPEAQKKQIQQFAHTLMDEYEIAAYKKIKIYVPPKDKIEYCNTFADEYSYQNFSALEKDMKNEFLFFNRSKEIQTRMKEKCLRVQNTFPKYREFKESDFKLLVR